MLRSASHLAISLLICATAVIASGCEGNWPQVRDMYCGELDKTSPSKIDEPLKSAAESVRRLETLKQTEAAARAARNEGELDAKARESILVQRRERMAICSMLQRSVGEARGYSQGLAELTEVVQRIGPADFETDTHIVALDHQDLCRAFADGAAPSSEAEAVAKSFEAQIAKFQERRKRVLEVCASAGYEAQ